VTGRVVQLPAKDALAVEQYLAQIRQTGLTVQDIEIRRPDLEDVFLKVMQQHPGRDDRSPA
jgi:ABC-2 type transport system ATP-binding protein